MTAEPEKLPPAKTTPLRAIYAPSEAAAKQSGEAFVIMNPDALEFYSDLPPVEDTHFAEAIEEAQEIVEQAMCDQRLLTDLEERRLAQLFAEGIDCEDLGLTTHELLRLRKRMD